MPLAVFFDSDGLVQYMVHTDGENAEADLAVHTDAPHGLSIIRFEDKNLETMTHQDVFDSVEAQTGKSALVTPPPAPEQIAIDWNAAAQRIQTIQVDLQAKADAGDLKAQANLAVVNDTIAATPSLANAIAANPIISKTQVIAP